MRDSFPPLHPRRFLRSRLVRWGLIVFGVGSGPLLLIILAAALGILDDPNPNPIGPGILAMLTFWPGIILVVIGVMEELRQEPSPDLPPASPTPARRAGSPAPDEGDGRGRVSSSWMDLAGVWWIRLAAAIGGILLAGDGAAELGLHGGRGAASEIVVGGALVLVSVLGRVPRWLISGRR